MNVISRVSQSTVEYLKKSGMSPRLCLLMTVSTNILFFSIARYKQFKEFNKRICVATDVFGRGIDIERINLAINYDLPADPDSYLHRVGRAGRFGTKGLSISFVSSKEDAEVMDKIMERFEVSLDPFPEDGIDAST